MGQVEDVEEFISSLVLSYWEERKAPYLLSAIGLKARRQFPDFRPPRGDGIREFCRGISTVQIVTHPTIPQKIGLIPATIQVPADVSSLFEHDDTQKPSIVYEDHFWRAFIDRSVSKRFVCLKNDGGFDVVESDTKPDFPDCFEITPTDLTAAAPDTPAAERQRLPLIESTLGLSGTILTAQYSKGGEQEMPTGATRIAPSTGSSRPFASCKSKTRREFLSRLI